MADEQTVQEQPTPQSWIAYIRQPLSIFQTAVGVMAGIVTVTGTVLSVNGISTTTKPIVVPQGEIVAYVQDAKLRKPLAEATVEILTAQNALVTTISVAADGRITRPLKEGEYRLRVSHPGFVTEVRPIEVQSGQRSDVRVSLALRPLPPAPPPSPPPSASPSPSRVVKAETKAEVKPDSEPGAVKQFLKTFFSPAHAEGPASPSK